MGGKIIRFTKHDNKIIMIRYTPDFSSYQKHHHPPCQCPCLWYTDWTSSSVAQPALGESGFWSRNPCEMKVK